MKCKKCETSTNFIAKKGVHNGLYCINCFAWIKWLNKVDYENAKMAGVKERG